MATLDEIRARFRKRPERDVDSAKSERVGSHEQADKPQPVRKDTSYLRPGVTVREIPLHLPVPGEEPPRHAPDQDYKRWLVEAASRYCDHMIVDEPHLRHAESHLNSLLNKLHSSDRFLRCVKVTMDFADHDDIGRPKLAMMMLDKFGEAI